MDPRPRGQRYPVQPGSKSSGMSVSLLCGWGPYTRCSTRLLPRDPTRCRRASSLLQSSSLYSNVALCIHTEQSPATQRRLPAGPDVPAFWHVAGHNGSLFLFPSRTRYCTSWAHRSNKDPFPARLPWGEKILVQYRCCYVLRTLVIFQQPPCTPHQGKNRTATMYVISHPTSLGTQKSSVCRPGLTGS